MARKMFTEEEMKGNAVRNLEKLNGYPPYTRAFKKGIITMYEGFAGFFLSEDNERDKEILRKIREVEEKYHGLVYAVIHDVTVFGELYSFLWQTAYRGDDKFSVQDGGGADKYVYAYVWNATDEHNSEFGDIGVVQRLGGLIRTA